MFSYVVLSIFVLRRVRWMAPLHFSRLFVSAVDFLLLSIVTFISHIIYILPPILRYKLNELAEAIPDARGCDKGQPLETEVRKLGRMIV
jgi:hypothetical protein